MSLPDISFTNNLGTIVFKRCLISLADRWQTNGRIVQHSKTIQIDGHIHQSFMASEGLEASLTAPTVARVKGTMGTLNLPWAAINNIKLQSISYQTGVWIGYQPISVTFTDDRPQDKPYTLHFFDLELHNPRFAYPIATRRLNDEYVAMPMSQQILIGAARGVIRTKTGARMMNLSLSGSIMCPPGDLPYNIIKTCTRRAGIDIVPANARIFSGWPDPFDLGDAIPEFKQDLNLAGVIIAGSRLTWRPERGVVSLNLDMLCQPQRLEVLAS